MPWNVLILLFILTFTETVDSKYLGVPNAIKDFKVSSDSECKSCARVYWRSYEYDTVFFKAEFIPVHNGEPFFVFASNIIEQFNMKYYGVRSMKKEFTAEVKGLKVNETYVVRVFALNERGQSPLLEMRKE